MYYALSGARRTRSRARSGGLGDWFETPGEGSDRLDALSTAWNSLRNDVWGRGISHRTDVPSSLANAVQEKWVGWRAWYNEVTSSLWSSTEQLPYWQSEYDRLYTAVENAKVSMATAPAPSTLPQQPGVDMDFTLPDFSLPTLQHQVTVATPTLPDIPPVQHKVGVSPSLIVFSVAMVAAVGAVVLAGRR